MGMEILATWECERCPSNEVCAVGEIPEGWKAISLLDLALTSDNAVDVKMPRPGDTLVLCNKCVGEHKSWAGIPPVDVPEDTAAVVEKETPEPEYEGRPEKGTTLSD